MAMWPHIHPHLIAALTQWADIQIYNLGGSLALVSSAASLLHHNYITKVEMDSVEVDRDSLLI